MHSFPGRAESLSAKLQGQFLPRKKRGFFLQKVKSLFIVFLFCFCQCLQGQRPLHLQHSSWMAQTNLSDILTNMNL